MLPKRQRLTSYGVERVQKKPSRGKEGVFQCSWKMNTVGYPRCAVVVTRGVPIGSIQRNRIRRVVYAALEEVLDGKLFSGDIIFFIRSTTYALGKEDVLGDVGRLILKVEEDVRNVVLPKKMD